jgi:hypothetical protein
MVNSRIAICAGIVIMSVSYGVLGEELRRGFTQPKTVVSEGKVYVMGEYHAGDATSQPGRLLLQMTSVDGGKVSEYVLPIVASHSLEGGETKTCWSLVPGRMWVLAESDQATKERNYNIVRMSTSAMGAYAIKDSAPLPQSQSLASGVELAEALPMQVQQSLRAQAMLDSQGSDSLLVRRGFDIHAASSDVVVLFLLVGSRMTVWSYSPGGYANIDGRVIGPYRLDGPPLTVRGMWRQLATFDVPFQSQFRVLHNGARVYLWTADGRLFECAGFDSRQRGPVDQTPMVQGGEAGYSPDSKSLARFLGGNEKRITVSRVADLASVSMVLEDNDGGKAYIMSGPQVRLIGSRERAMILQQPQGKGQGLIADAMDMVRTFAAGSKAIREPNEPNVPFHHRPQPKPIEQEPNKPANTY